MPEQSPCDIPRCKNYVTEGMRFCPDHCVWQANRWCLVHGHSFTDWFWSGIYGPSSSLGRRIVENALLMLLFERSGTGPFAPKEESWREDESRTAYEFLRQHLDENLF